MDRRKFLGTAAVAATALAVPYRKAIAAPVSMRVGTSTLGDVQHEWMIAFQNIVTEKADGAIEVEIYPASQLGATTRMIEQTQFNTQQCVIAPPEFLGGIDPRFQILSSPGLFDDLQHTTRALTDPEFNEYFLGLGADRGLVGAGLFISGPSAFVSREPISSPADFSGKKVRVLSAEFQLEQVRTMGATPLPMPPSEVLPALQQGTLDAVMSCLPVFEGLGYMDGAPYLTETNHGVISTVAMFSSDWLEEQSEEVRTLVLEAGEEATRAVEQFSYDDIDDAREQWVAKGGEVVELTAEQRAAFTDVLLPVGPEVVGDNAQLQEAYGIMQAAIERSRTA